MNPDRHRQLGIQLPRSRCPDVEVKTILATHGITFGIKLLIIIDLSIGGWTIHPIGLNRGRAEFIRLHHTHPRNHWLGCLPSQISHRWSRKRNPFINQHTSRLSRHSLNLSAGDRKPRLLRTHMDCEARQASQDPTFTMVHSLFHGI